jgi:hypothetical protein
MCLLTDGECSEVAQPANVFKVWPCLARGVDFA